MADAVTGAGLDEFARLLAPERLLTRDEVLDRPSPVPAVPGVYAWYFDEPPSRVPLEGCHSTDLGVLLYVGISPQAPRSSDARPSRQDLRKRLRNHYRGNASGSTLRLTLGSLLAVELGIGLRRVGASERLTFAEGEAVLSDWMGAHARVCWLETPTPWLTETRLIEALTLPLNLSQNARSGFRADLSAARSAQRQKARELPPLPGVRARA